MCACNSGIISEVSNRPFALKIQPSSGIYPGMADKGRKIEIFLTIFPNALFPSYYCTQIERNVGSTLQRAGGW